MKQLSAESTTSLLAELGVVEAWHLHRFRIRNLAAWVRWHLLLLLLLRWHPHLARGLVGWLSIVTEVVVADVIVVVDRVDYHWILRLSGHLLSNSS